MSTFGPLIDTFERLMAAVAFAEHNDRETACWILKSETPRRRVHVAEVVNKQVARQPEMRL